MCLCAIGPGASREESQGQASLFLLWFIADTITESPFPLPSPSPTRLPFPLAITTLSVSRGKATLESQGYLQRGAGGGGGLRGGAAARKGLSVAWSARTSAEGPQ